MFLLIIFFISSSYANELRAKRQIASGNLPCLPVTVLSGTANYAQSVPSQPYASGTSATIICNLGFVIQGPTTTVCQNGAWTPLPGICVPTLGGNGIVPGTPISTLGGANCLDIPIPLSGSVQYSILSTGRGSTPSVSTPPSALGSHPVGTVATMTCNLGTVPCGTVTSTCTNGVWSPATLGTCNLPGLNGIGTACGVGK